MKPVLALCLLSLLIGAACGGDDETTAAPTSVTAADLDKDGALWVKLTSDLKDEMIDCGRQRLGADRPDGQTGIRAMDTADLVSEVDKQYANKSKRTVAIYDTDVGANDKFAKEDLDDALTASTSSKVSLRDALVRHERARREGSALNAGSLVRASEAVTIVRRSHRAGSPSAPLPLRRI